MTFIHQCALCRTNLHVSRGRSRVRRRFVHDLPVGDLDLRVQLGARRRPVGQHRQHHQHVARRLQLMHHVAGHLGHGQRGQLQPPRDVGHRRGVLRPDVTHHPLHRLAQRRRAKVLRRRPSDPARPLRRRARAACASSRGACCRRGSCAIGRHGQRVDATHACVQPLQVLDGGVDVAAVLERAQRLFERAYPWVIRGEVVRPGRDVKGAVEPDVPLPLSAAGEGKQEFISLAKSGISRTSQMNICMNHVSPSVFPYTLTLPKCVPSLL